MSNRSHLVNLHSIEQGKVPTSDNLEIGEIAINGNSADPFISIKDSNGDIRQFKTVDVYEASATTLQNNINALRTEIEANAITLEVPDTDKYISGVSGKIDSGGIKFTISSNETAITEVAAEAISTHNTATGSHADIRTALDNCVKLTGQTSQTINGDLSIGSSLTVTNGATIKSTKTPIVLDIEDNHSSINPIVIKNNGAPRIAMEYNGTQYDFLQWTNSCTYIGRYDAGLDLKGDTISLCTDSRPCVARNDITIKNEKLAYLSEITPQATTADIDTLTAAKVAPYYHNENATISGTLPDGVTSADGFRLEVLPIGSNCVEQCLILLSDGTRYVRCYDPEYSWSSWCSLFQTATTEEIESIIFPLA